MLRQIAAVLGLAALIAGGAWMRTLPAGWLLSPVVQGFAWQTSTTVNLYFVRRAFLFPVSRRLQATAQLPRAVLEALIAGPSPSSGLKSAIPREVALRSFSVVNTVARIDLSRGLGGVDDERLALAVITETMTGVPGIRSVAVSVEEQSIGGAASRIPLLYFPAADGLVAVASHADSARTALAAYLLGAPAPEMTGMPSDVR